MDELSAFHTRSPAASRPIVRYLRGDPLVTLLKDPGDRIWPLTVYVDQNQRFTADSLPESVGKIAWAASEHFQLPPGVYRADLIGAEDTIPAWLEVRGVSTIDQPITPASVWMAMLDAVPADNTLLDDYEYGDEEIAAAITRVIDIWNAIPPDGIGVYSAATFPWREKHLEAACGILLRQKSILMLRNSLEFSGSGLTATEANKYREYAQIGEAKLAEFQVWAKQKKHELNLQAFYGNIGGFYSRGVY